MTTSVTPPTQLGHEDPRFTLKVYAQAAKRRDRLSVTHREAYDRALVWAQIGTSEPFSPAAFDIQATKTPPSGVFLERMMGLEPTTFCMARASDVRARSHACAQTACLHRFPASERTDAHPSERRTLPFLPRFRSGDREAFDRRFIAGERDRAARRSPRRTWSGSAAGSLRELEV